MSMSIPYELSGRVDQKRRTRDALIAAARDIVATGTTPEAALTGLEAQAARLLAELARVEVRAGG